jgi:DNA-binding response OmpR family regulator
MMRLLVVEDSLRFQRLVTSLLANSGFVIDAVETVADAQSALATATYDLILLDLTLPDGDGGEVLRKLRRARQGTPVLVMTARGDVEHRVQALNEGADDYLVKPFSLEELLARIRAVLRRPTQTVGVTLAAGNVLLEPANLSLQIAGAAVDVSRREIAVLEALLRNQGRLLPRARLEQAVYSFDDEVTPNALEATISRLRRKLEAHGADVSITAMRGLGYAMTPRETVP